MDPKWGIKVGGDSIVHNDELSLRGRNLERLIELEIRVIYGLMEVVVVEHNLTAHCVGTTSHDDIVIEHKLERWVTMEIALHLDAAVDAGVDHVARSIEDHADLFIDIDKYFVLLVFAHCHLAGLRGYGVGREQRKRPAELRHGE